MTAERLLIRLRKLRLILATPSYRRALRYRVAASIEHHHVPLPEGIRTVVDVGANRGQFALVARERWPTARLICFEPLPRALAVLRRVLHDRPQTEIVDAAIGAGSGRAMLHVSRSEDSSSLLAITELQTRTFPGTDEISAIDVPTTSLDECLDHDIERPVLLKIDVQGFELEVLRGANRLLKVIDVVLVECSFEEFYSGQAKAEDVIRFLHDRGFALAGASAPSLDRHGVILQLDLIFIRRPDQQRDVPSVALRATAS